MLCVVWLRRWRHWLGVDALRMLELSLASAVNLEGPVTIVTHDSFPTHEVLKKIVGKYSYTSILSVPDAEIPDDRTQWVLWVDRLKVSFLTRNLGDNVVYVELDQIFAPGTGQAFTKVFVDYDFDLALSYKNNADRFGTTNTGVMLFRASKDSLYFLKRVIDATAVITNPKGKSTGGENQLAIDEVVKKRIPQGRQKTIKLENNRSVFCFLGYPVLNYNARVAVTCRATLVAHLKAFKKQFAFQACCRKFAGNRARPHGFTRVTAHRQISRSSAQSSAVTRYKMPLP